MKFKLNKYNKLQKYFDELISTNYQTLEINLVKLFGDMSSSARGYVKNKENKADGFFFRDNLFSK